ncbi:unnamed protein product [Clonostachys byssicola]|uniref:Zn(2)-C6 fungal-type domain-containing protein n=1 Tax=Clonostachys byssicola TaxID=160290 RepID=A0A9N9UV42_9HYPO|nr:unnamed protein product [Clonostachys byssicola]
MSLNNTPRPAQLQRTEKVLACVNCQHRKKKCDRASPCSLCIKTDEKQQLDVPCTPSTPAPRRKRRKKTREMIDRLERCEALLMQWVASDGCTRSVRQWLCDNDDDNDNIGGGKSRISRVARLAHNHSYHNINVKPAAMLLRKYSEAFQAMPCGTYN